MGGLCGGGLRASHLVLKTVVEYETAATFPRANLLAHANASALGDDEAHCRTRTQNAVAVWSCQRHYNP
eukprot:6045349-Prymnesium_polylepis.2